MMQQQKQLEEDTEDEEPNNKNNNAAKATISIKGKAAAAQSNVNREVQDKKQAGETMVQAATKEKQAAAAKAAKKAAEDAEMHEVVRLKTTKAAKEAEAKAAAQAEEVYNQLQGIEASSAAAAEQKERDAVKVSKLFAANRREQKRMPSLGKPTIHRKVFLKQPAHKVANKTVRCNSTSPFLFAGSYDGGLLQE
jgi:hypothetical protein